MNSLLILIGLVGLGLIFGSFTNALAWRLHEHRDWVNERSECPHCHHVLAAKDLVPLLSYLMLRGKCRYCKKPIDDTPLPEVVLPLLFAGSYIWWPLSMHGIGLFLLVTWMVFLVAFMALAVYDLRWFLLPNKIVYPLIGLAVMQVLAVAVHDKSWHYALMSALGALLLSGMFYALFWISDGNWIGGGDVKLAIVLGLLAGSPLRAALILFLSSLVGTVASIPVIIRTGSTKGIKIPFGPFLIAGMILVELFGASIIMWYGNFFVS